MVVGGLGFLLARPALWAVPGGTVVLAGGYLVLLAAAAAAAGRARTGPAAWPVVLVVGVAAVAGAALAGGPAPPLRADAVAVALSLLAAVAEEALFRGALWAVLARLGASRRRGRLGPALPLVGSAVVFAVLHLPHYGVAALPVDLGAGLLLGWQRWASGRWTVPAATHAAANLLAVITR